MANKTCLRSAQLCAVLDIGLRGETKKGGKQKYVIPWGNNSQHCAQLRTAQNKQEVENATMGEAKRRADVYRLEQMPLPNDGGVRTLVGSVLVALANLLEAGICLKQPDDGLLDWPLGSLVGQAIRLEAVRQCPLAIDIRPTSKQTWEFVIPDKVAIGAYCVHADARGLPFPGLIHPDQFMDRVREFFHARNAFVILPEGWGRAMASRQGALQ